MWDWRYPINDIRDEVRKTRSNGEKTVSLDGIDKLLDELSSVYERLESEDAKTKENDDRELQDFIQKQKEVITNSYEHAKQYTHIIVLGGYAGLFAIWNFTKDTLSNWQVWSVGLFTLTSLLIYIVLELYGSWLRTTQVNNQLKELLKAEQLNKFPEEYGKGEISRVNKFMAIWPYFFFSSVAFALVAAFILIYSFIYSLVCTHA